MKKYILKIYLWIKEQVSFKNPTALACMGVYPLWIIEVICAKNVEVEFVFFFFLMNCPFKIYSLRSAR